MALFYLARFVSIMYKQEFYVNSAKDVSLLCI